MPIFNPPQKFPHNVNVVQHPERAAVFTTSHPGNSGISNFVPYAAPTDHRPVRAVVTEPNVQFYDPNALHFVDAQGPVIRDNGGYHSMGITMVAYRPQSVYNRSAESLAGPVRSFFRQLMRQAVTVQHV